MLKHSLLCLDSLVYANEEKRSSARHAGPADSENAVGQAITAWLCHHHAYSRGLRRPPASGGGLFVSRASADGRGRMGNGRVGNDGEKPAGPVLCAYLSRTKAAG